MRCLDGRGNDHFQAGQKAHLRHRHVGALGQATLGEEVMMSVGRFVQGAHEEGEDAVDEPEGLQFQGETHFWVEVTLGVVVGGI